MDVTNIRYIIFAVVFAFLFFAPIKLRSEQHLKLAFAIWMVGGFVLLWLGIYRFITIGDMDIVSVPALGGAALALGIGFAKGKFVLSKTSRRNIDRLMAIEEPTKLSNVYSTRSWIIIMVMIGISLALNLGPVDPYWRGVVNMAIGMGLVASSLVYLKPHGQDSESIHTHPQNGNA